MRTCLICAAVALTISATPAPARLAAATNDSGFDLLHRLHRAGENTFLSPTSIGMALQMASRGASGATLSQMEATLHTSGIDVAAGNRELIPELCGRSGIILDIANSVWVDPRNVTVDKTFASSISSDFHGEVFARDFRSPATLDAANRWISEKTSGKIPRMLDYIRADEVVLLVNAVYFKGQWTRKFDKTRTADADFHLSSGAAKRVPMMTANGRYRYAETSAVQIIALPFGNEQAVEMWIALPRKQDGLDAFINRLGQASWKALAGRASERPGMIRLPRFKMGYRALLNDPLRALGMQLPFTPAADFTKLGRGAKGSIYISRVLHDARVEVNEEGAEASAATVIGAIPTSLPAPAFQMVCDRPFLLLIADRATDAILFIGAVYNPE